ncbi:MAG TPA: ATP synthase F1 subunit epsilon [Candidatus Baltobacteraceae bacterium]|jgi:F-type H+-transporting ATPase subunit epsilon|nr:ATP synthase F1 subunit epsilon [Candidatus Baltobacteraceae bacterium]
MANTIPFSLITPTAVVYDGPAEFVIAVGTEGEEGILPSHAPLLTALRPGVLRADIVHDGKTQRVRYATGQGFLQALPDRITILVDLVAAPDDVDPAGTRAELAAAEERQKSLTPQTPEFEREQALVDFATAKLALVA